MSADTRMKKVGPEKEPGVEVGLPRTAHLISPEGSCELVVNSGGQSDTTSWFDIWVTTRVVSAM